MRPICTSLVNNCDLHNKLNCFLGEISVYLSLTFNFPVPYSAVSCGHSESSNVILQSSRLSVSPKDVCLFSCVLGKQMETVSNGLLL